MTGIYRSAAGERAVEERYRRLLEQWPVPNEQRTVPTSQGDTFVVVSGPTDGLAVFLLHGSAGNTITWMGDVAALAEHFRVYAVDMIGEPGLSAPSRPRLDSGVFAPWLAEVWDALGVARAAVVGMSLGGWLALQFATTYPERVERLALLCPAGIGRQTYGKLLLALLARPFGKWGRRTASRLILGASLDQPGNGLAKAVTDFVALVNKSFKPRQGKVPVCREEQLSRLRMPVLAIVGARDAMIDSAETKRRLETQVPDATVTWLPEAGHLLLGQTQPILAFLTAPSQPDTDRVPR